MPPWQLCSGQDPSLLGGSPQLSLHLLEVRAQCHRAPSCAGGSCQQQDSMGLACEPPPLVSLSVLLGHRVGGVLPACTGANRSHHSPL